MDSVIKVMLVLMMGLSAIFGPMLFLMPEVQPEMCPMGMTGMQMAAMQTQDPPPSQEQPPADDPENPTPGEHKQPTEICTPRNRPDGKMPCLCVMKNPEGCKAGHRETETSVCNSWCWKSMCHCCGS